MPVYEVEAPDGRVLEFEGPQPPSEAIIRDAFRRLGPAAPQPQPQPQPTPKGEGEEPTDRSSAAGRFLGGAWEMLNPVAAVQGLAQAVMHPLDTAEAIGAASMDQIERGAQAGREGRWGEAIARTAAGVPVVGPLAAGIAERAAEGDIAGAAGNLAGLAAGPAALKGLARGGRAVARGARAVGETLATKAPAPVREAVEWGVSQGIPVDAATATANPAIRRLQQTSDASLGGAPVSMRANAARDAALTRTAEKLAARTGAGPATAEQAGQAVRDGVEGVIRREAQTADEAYEMVRRAERNAEPEQVPTKDPLAPAASVDPERAFFLRWLMDDLDNQTFQRQGSRGREIDALENYSIDAEAEAAQVMRRANARVAGTPVYDMLRAAGLSGSRAQQADAVRRVLTGQSKNPRVVAVVDIMRNAWDGQRFDLDLVPDEAWQRAGLARGEFRAPSSIPRPDFPGAERVLGPDAAMSGPAAQGPTEAMRLAVDLTSAKESLRPILDRLNRKRELTGSLMGAEGRAAVALDALVNGPDFAPLSVVDAALGDIKALARGADMPELRNTGQGIAAQAVKDLDALVQLRAEAEGPELLEALQRGRAATVAKWSAAEVRDALNAEPVRTFKALTAQKDSGIERLREVAKLAPEALPKVGRAVLDDMVERATAEGGFQSGLRLAAEWDKLGPSTKALLYPEAPLRADLDRFFLLVKRMAENPNPSGTAATALVSMQGAGLVVNPAAGAASIIGGAVLSSALRNQRVVRLLMEGMKTPARAPRARVLASKLKDALTAAAGKVPAKGAAYPAGTVLSQQTTAQAPQ